MILPRNHFYIVRCSCEHVEVCDSKPFAAQRLARAHAMRHPEHLTLVVDMTKLEVPCRYQFDALVGSNGPTDDPPY